MDAQIIINSIDQTQYLLSISRSYNYCSVSQEFTIELDLSCPTTINTYDPIVIYEEGVKVLTGYVGTIVKKAPEAKITVKGQDVYVKASDFFVPTTYTTTFGQTVQYWVTFLLNLAGLTATFTDGVGPTVIAEQEIGLAPVADILVQMLQYAGWYGRVDPNGIIIFGKIDKIPLPYEIIEGVNILSDEIDQSYDKTRNKAIIFGGVDTRLNRFEQIIAVAEVDMPVLPVDQTVVVGNSLIADQDSADNFANALVNEFAKLTQIKQVKVLGNPHFQAGHFVNVHSDIFTGLALITSMKSEFSESGYIMDLTLDDPCPRIVAAIKHQPELYAGTTSHGVWTYNVYSGAWENISAGLTNLHVNDLSVDNGLHIVATPAGIYTKLADDPWVKQNLPLYSGAIAANLVYSGVYANLFDNQVHAIVTSDNDDFNYAWFYTGTIASGGTGFRWSGNPIRYSGQISYSGEYYAGLDLEGNYGSKYIVARYQTDDSTDKTFYIVSGIHIYSMDTHGSNITPLVQSPTGQTATTVTPSPAGKYITFVADFNGQMDVYVGDTSGQEYNSITNIGGCLYPSWSYDETTIIFVSNTTGRNEIYTVSTEGNNLTQITTSAEELNFSYPRFADSNTIFFSREGATGYIQIFAMNLDGSNLLQITDGEFDSYVYRYGEAQLKALYITNGGGDLDTVNTVGTTGGDPSTLYENSDELSAPNITTGDKLIIFSENGKIYIAGIAYQDTERITNGGVGDDVQSQGFGKLQNSNIIFNIGADTYSINIDGTELTLISTDGGEINLFGNKTGFWVAQIGAAISKFFRSSDGANLTEVTTAEDMTKDILDSASQGHGWAVSQDGSKIAFFRENDILLNPPTKDYDLYEFSSSGSLTRLTNDQGNGNSTWKGYSISGSLAYNFSNEVVIFGVGSFTGVFRAWSTTSETLFYTKTGTSPEEIWSYSAENGHAKVYTCETNYTVESVKVSPNGEFMAVEEFRTTLFSNVIYVTKIGTNTKTTLTGTQSNQSYDLDWTEDSDSVIFRGSVFNSIENLYVRSPKIELTDGTLPYHRTTTIRMRTRLLETFDNQEMFLIAETFDDLQETNVDTYIPIVFYGPDGNPYSSDYILFSGSIASGVPTYDVAIRTINTEKQMFATTSSGIYKTIVSGLPVLKNVIGATEIVSRYYGSGEIFFSVGAQVKQSLTECATYTDISSGLPGSTITVLRMDK